MSSAAESTNNTMEAKDSTENEANLKTSSEEQVDENLESTEKKDSLEQAVAPAVEGIYIDQVN